MLRFRVTVVQGLVVRALMMSMALGCSSSGDDDDTGAPGSGGGGSGGAATSASGGSGGASMTTGSGGTSGSGGSKAQPDSGTAMQPKDGGGTQAMSDAAMPGNAVTECDGKKLPPRAIATPGPYAIGPAAAGLEEYWPNDDWREKTPAELGFDPTALQAAADYETQYSSTQALLIIRHGYIALEKYYGGFSATQRHESYSMAKSFSSALLGIAIDEKLIKGVDEKVCQYYPDEWDCSDTSDPRSRITIHHVETVSTGLEWHEDWRSTATGTNDAYNLNLLDYTLSRMAVSEPGVMMRYSTGDPSLLSGILQEATGMTALAYAKTKLFAKIGTPGITWNSDNKGRTTTYAGLGATAREYAKFGYLYLNGGKWNGEQIVPSAWVEMTTRAKDPCTDWYYYNWHVNPPVRLGTQDGTCADLVCTPTAYADLPPDTFFAAGVNGQLVFIVPSADVVIVRLANDSPGSEHWDEYGAGLLDKVLLAID
jgi:CubicO group peptidase (beta-lactamase class C family)